MNEAHPTETARLFQHERVARGYATARPYLHPELMALVRELVGAPSALGRAPGVRYSAATAEALPFRGGAFDLILACGAIDWIDREQSPPPGRSRPRSTLPS